MSATTFLSQFKQMNKKESQSIQFVDLPYQPDLAKQYFATIEQIPWAMLLKSSTLEHENNRFDILVADPVATVQTFGEQSKIHCDGAEDSSSDDPFTLINNLIAEKIGHIDIETSWPFLGGALGYFAYDLGRRVERIPETASHDIAAPDMAIGIYDWALMVDHQKKKAVIVALNQIQSSIGCRANKPKLSPRLSSRHHGNPT